jgi:hypothetical protein
MNNEYRIITPEEIFFIFKEEHRLCSPFDCEADPTVELTMDSTIREWRESMDLLPWKQLSRYLNEEFEINITENEWKTVFEPEKEMKLKGICELISKYAKIEIVRPIKSLGQECLSASLFKTIKRNLSKRGVDTSELKPSSLIEPYLKNHFGEFIEQINKNYTGVIPEIIQPVTRISKTTGLIWLFFLVSLIIGAFWNKILILSGIALVIGIAFLFAEKVEFKSKDDMMFVPGIKTFRDLVETIIDKKYATQHYRI